MKTFTSQNLLGLCILTLAAAGCSKTVEPTPEVVDTAPVNNNTPAPSVEAAPPVNAAPEVAPVAAKTLDEGSLAKLSSTKVFFQFDSSTLTGASKTRLADLAVLMKANPGAKVQVEGHCDARGSNEYNLALGERRATGVKEFLSAEGVSTEDLSTVSYGEERPENSGSGEGSWSKNRRAEFKPQ